MTDNVNHPKHYTQHASGVECVTIVEQFNFNRGSAIKYIWRAGIKTCPQISPQDIEIQDLEKAICALQQEIRRLRYLQKTGIKEVDKEHRVIE